MIKRGYLFLLALIAYSVVGFAQVQSKIMVVPFTKEGEDIRKMLENDGNLRIALTKVKEGFDARGATTVDFIAKLKSAMSDAAMSDGNQTDFKTMLIGMSGADIYVDTDLQFVKSSSGNSVKIVLTAYEISTGNSLSNKVGESRQVYTEDVAKLASMAIEGVIDDFLSVMQTKFNDIVENGASIKVNIGFGADSEYSMASEIGDQGLTLGDELQLWFEENAYKGNYHIQGTTDKQMILDDVKIPLKDPKNGSAYNSQKFGLEMFKFFRSLGLAIKRDVKGNTLIITIQ